ncbi:hypothetical protein H5410_050648 [Solanum commersonii]|uniref:Uncharacterized protein n=1 Tax=Solanum commersonii TaxID=4109 RepID=A0A9J5WXM9_SOLCO|nr:hypothetical protein H5410_050648 [Solanum commersonii]
MQESSTQENEESGTITFDALFEETYESLEVDSEQYSVHKTEELDKNGFDLKSSESLNIRMNQILYQVNNMK